MTSPSPNTPQRGRSREPTPAIEGAPSPNRTTAPRAVSAPPGSPGLINAPLRDSVSAAEMEVDASLEKGSTRPQSQDRSRSRSRSRSQGSNRSRHRDEEWRVETRLRIPHHRHPCVRCDDYIEHALWADDSENESLEGAFQRIAHGYGGQFREEITRLQARLDESRNARERDATRWERANRDAQRWKDEQDAARSRTRELEAEVEQLRAAARGPSTTTVTPIREAASAALASTAPPATRPAPEGVRQPAPGYSQTPPLGPRPSFASCLGAAVVPRPTTVNADAGSSRPLAPRPAPPGDETLARRLYDQQWDDYDEDHEDQLDLEDELWREERDAKRGKRGKGKAKTKASMGPRTAAPPGAEGPVTGDKRKAAPSSPTGVRPSPSAPPRFTQPRRAPAHSALLRPPPTRPATPGEWMLVRNTHWLRDDGSPEVRAWIDLSDGEILSLFSPGRQRETGEATRLQRLLMAAPMPSDRNNRSFAQNQ
ncbi:hypothetical protein BDV93DRAFT_563207, partial [Ceratobasidium sp. AG-I]